MWQPPHQYHAHDTIVSQYRAPRTTRSPTVCSADTHGMPRRDPFDILELSDRWVETARYRETRGTHGPPIDTHTQQPVKPTRLSEHAALNSKVRWALTACIATLLLLTFTFGLKYVWENTNHNWLVGYTEPTAQDSEQPTHRGPGGLPSIR